MISTVSEKGQVTLPKSLRERLGIRPGTRLEFSVDAEGRMTATVLARGSAGLAGLLGRRDEPTRSLADMEEAVAAAVVERSRRAR